jgi:hypothetical protein
VDTKPDPTKANIHKIIEPEEVFKKTGYSRPSLIHPVFAAKQIGVTIFAPWPS